LSPIEVNKFLWQTRMHAQISQSRTRCIHNYNGQIRLLFYESKPSPEKQNQGEMVETKELCFLVFDHTKSHTFGSEPQLASSNKEKWETRKNRLVGIAHGGCDFWKERRRPLYRQLGQIHCTHDMISLIIWERYS
jgi:hypothetical protein